MRVASSALAIACAIAVGGVGLAHAETADEAFHRGRTLLKARKYAKACAAFEASQKLDPSLGTQFNIAQCDEHIGKLASALEIYRGLADHDTNAQRKAISAKLAARLEPRVPRLQLQVEPRPPGLVVTIDNVPCGKACDPSSSKPIDLGTYTIEVTAPGYRPRATRVTVSLEGKVVLVPIQLERAPKSEQATTASDYPAPPKREVAPTPAPAVHDRAEGPSQSRRKIYAKVLLGASVAQLAGGIALGLLARDKWDQAKQLCGGTQTCPDPFVAADANDLADAARLRGNVSTTLFVGSGVAAAVGIVLWVKAPEQPVQVTATVGGHDVGIVARGRF